MYARVHAYRTTGAHQRDYTHTPYIDRTNMITFNTNNGINKWKRYILSFPNLSRILNFFSKTFEIDRIVDCEISIFLFFRNGYPLTPPGLRGPYGPYPLSTSPLGRFSPPGLLPTHLGLPPGLPSHLGVKTEHMENGRYDYKIL